MKLLPEAVQKELAALAEMTDEDIDFSDIPATAHEYWEGAVRGRFYRPVETLHENNREDGAGLEAIQTSRS